MVPDVDFAALHYMGYEREQLPCLELFEVSLSLPYLTVGQEMMPHLLCQEAVACCGVLPPNAERAGW
eukprot:14180389-Ditylum_brightwellii.AAC.1